MNYLDSKDTKELFKAFLSLKNETECKKFLRDLLTEAEIKEFSNRWKVARMLDAKISYEEIEKQTGMSSTTIARIQKWLTGKIGGYRLLLERLATSPDDSFHSGSRTNVPMVVAIRNSARMKFVGRIRRDV